MPPRRRTSVPPAQLAKPPKVRKVYLRFGDVPKTGKSGIGAGFRRQHAVMGIRIPTHERGVSVYEAFEGPPGVYEIRDARLESLDQLLAEACAGERSIYLVTGRRVSGEGSDGEPLLRDVQIQGTVEPHQIRNAEVWPDGGDGMVCLPPTLRALVAEIGRLRTQGTVLTRLQQAGVQAQIEHGSVFIGYHRTGRILDHPAYQRKDVPWLNGHRWIAVYLGGHRWIVDPEQSTWGFQVADDVFREDDEQHDYKAAAPSGPLSGQVEALRSHPKMHRPLAGGDCTLPDPTVTWAGFPWPACTPLYHATGAVPAILAEGFRTRAQGAPAAAGGGHHQSVSFTLVRKRAASIALGIDTLARGAQGTLTLTGLISRLQVECPKGAARVLRKPWSIEAFPADMDLPEILARYDGGQARYYWYAAPTWMEAWIPREDPPPAGYSGRTPYTRESAFFEVYASVLRAGMWEGECFNPYFTGTDLGRLAILDRAHIGILECQIEPGMRVCGRAEGLAHLGYMTSGEAQSAETDCEHAVHALARARQQAARSPAHAVPPTPEHRALANELAWAEEGRESRILWHPRLPAWQADYQKGNQAPEETLVYSESEQEVRVYDPTKIRIIRSTALPVLRRIYRLGDRITFPPFTPEEEVPKIWDPPRTRSR